MLPAAKVEKERDFYFTMLGAEVLQFACNKGSELIKTLIDRNSVRPDKVITHQANINIIKEIAKRTDISYDDFYVNVQCYANTAGASCLIALNEFLETGACAENIFMAVFGGGLSWGGAYLKRSMENAL